MTRLAGVGLALVLWALGTVLSASAADLTDAEIETILLGGKITRHQDIGTGVTRPLRLWLELGGRSLSASYKDVDQDRRGITRFEGGGVELNFTDSYKYERAAYLLDRELSLGMVPVSVFRKLWRRQGAVTHWIEGAINEKERLARELSPDDLMWLVDQKADMRLFDALIFNTDRNAGNQLYTLDDWRLHLIDHSRSFRVLDELPESFGSRPMTISRSMLARLETLEERDLMGLLKGVLGPRQIRSVLKRRDLILEKIGHDRLQYGDSFVFREEGRDR